MLFILSYSTLPTSISEHSSAKLRLCVQTEAQSFANGRSQSELGNERHELFLWT